MPGLRNPTGLRQHATLIGPRQQHAYWAVQCGGWLRTGEPFIGTVDEAMPRMSSDTSNRSLPFFQRLLAEVTDFFCLRLWRMQGWRLVTCLRISACASTGLDARDVSERLLSFKSSC